MIGEHGNSQFAPWSQVAFGSHKLEELVAEDERFRFDRDAMIQETVDGAWTVFAGKGCTEYAIAATAARIIRAIFHDEKAIIPVSAPLDGDFDEHDVFAGVPAIIGKDGCEEVVELHLTDEELEHFHKCCVGIRENIKVADEM
jgi:L-lactate dehydrogenase